MPITSKRKTIMFIKRQALYIGALVLAIGIILASRGFFRRLFVIFHTVPSAYTSTSDVDAARIATLETENTTLKELLGRMPPQTKGVLARVITKPNQSIYDTMLIDAGARDGIVVGKTVYALGTVALGKVTAVYADTALVTLFSASGNQIAGSVVSSGVSLTLSGRGAGEYELRMPRDIRFVRGDVIVEQSTHAKILGVVESVEADSRDPFTTIRAKAPVNIQTLPWVIIM